MDALSLTANVLAVVGAASRLAQTLENLRSFKEAPDQLLQVINEVSDIRSVLTVVERMCTELETIDIDRSISIQFQDLLLQAERHFEVINAITSKLIRTQDHRTRQPKVSWRLWMRERRNVQIQSLVLRDLKRKISELLAVLQVSNIPKVQLRVMEIATSQDETRKQVDLIANHMLEMQTRQSSIQEKLQSLQMVSTASDPHQQKPALQSIVHIPVAIHRQQPCRMFCMCRCHQKTTLATRAWMQQLVGTLFIGGRVSELRELFTQGLASPFDVDAAAGTSCLQYAVAGGHVDMCRFLLSEYADPNHYDRRLMSCLSHICISEKVQHDWSPAKAEIRYLLRDFLEDYHTQAQELGFTFIHQILFGMIPIDLRTHLSITTADIDIGCSGSKTPLMWATTMSDLTAMQSLLEFGANITLSDSCGRNVFHMAAWHGSVEALKLLLDPIATDPEKSASFRRAIDQPNIYGITPLCTALLRGRTACALRILQVPCTINPPYPIIDPLLPAIQTNNHEIITYLLENEASTDCKDTDQMGVLHIAACFANVKTLLILLDNPPRNAGVTDADNYGNTRMRCFEVARMNYVKEDVVSMVKSREVFERLLNEVNLYRSRL